MNNRRIPVLIISVLVVTSFIGFKIYTNFSKSKFIVASPFNVSQITQVSKFRSCYGEDYSGYNDKMEIEENRSMKHYIVPRSNFLNSNESVSVFSPFDGFIVGIIENNSRDGAQVKIALKGAQDYQFIFFHINPKEGLTKTSEVKAGQLIGYAQLQNRGNFDIALKKVLMNEEKDMFLSPFDYMSPNILSEFTDRGLKLDDIILSKGDRDNIPCTLGADTGPDEWISLD